MQTEFAVTIGRLRWEYLTVPIKADTSEDAERAAAEEYKAGRYENQDWNAGDVVEQEATDDHYDSPDFYAEEADAPGDTAAPATQEA